MATFYFSKLELEYLTPRQKVVTDLRLELEALDLVIKQFVIYTVFKRLGIDVAKQKCEFDITAGTITVEDEPKTEKTGGKKDKKTP